MREKRTNHAFHTRITHIAFSSPTKHVADLQPDVLRALFQVGSRLPLPH